MLRPNISSVDLYAELMISSKKINLFYSMIGGFMKTLLVIIALLLTTNVYGKEPITQSQVAIEKYANAVLAASKKVDQSKGTVVDRLIFVFKNPAEKLGYDFDKTLQLCLKQQLIYTLNEIIIRPLSLIRENADESRKKNLISEQTYNIIKAQNIAEEQERQKAKQAENEVYEIFRRNQEESDRKAKQNEEQIREELKRRDQEEKARQLKQIELANKEEQEQKQELVNKLGGHYALASEDNGTLDIKVVSNDKAIFSFFNKLGSGNMCKMDNKEGVIQYVYDDELLIVHDNGGCEVRLKYKNKKTRHTIDISKKGCDAFCEEGGITTGQYKR
jgi:hypothetical protein